MDDDERFSSTLGDILRHDGHTVVCEPSGLRALDRLRWGLSPSVMIVDLRMPVMSGWDLYREIKLDPRLARIPVIAVTAYNWKTDDGFRWRMRKPLDLLALRIMMEHCCL